MPACRQAMKTGSWDFIEGWAPGKFAGWEDYFLGPSRDMWKKNNKLCSTFLRKDANTVYKCTCRCVDYAENTLDYAEIATAKEMSKQQ